MFYANSKSTGKFRKEPFTIPLKNKTKSLRKFSRGIQFDMKKLIT